jgi:uncharacterized protein YpiB (UPF0302 family)
MTEAQLGELMRAQARREGHRGRLPDMHSPASWQNEEAQERKEALEEAIYQTMCAKGRSMLMQEIVTAIDETKRDAIQNAVRRMKTRGALKTILESRSGKSAVVWRLA